MSDSNPPTPSPKAIGAIAAALVLTVAAGVAMRWALAGRVPMVWDFTRLRHAHAHMGYYGLLIPLVWLGWSSSKLPAPSTRTVAVYALAVVLAVTGFLKAGYAIESIVGSTTVGAIWLWSAWSLRKQLSNSLDPIGVVPMGMTVSLACIPFVAKNTGTPLVQEWVGTFLASLLLLVVLPSALGILKVARSWPALLVSGLLGALALGVWSGPLPRVGLAVFGLLLLPLRWPPQPLHIRVAWTALGLGVLGMAAGWIPNTRPVVIGAVHYAVLSVALPSLSSIVGLPGDHKAWWFHHGAVGLLCLPIVLQAFGAGAWTWEASALGGTAVCLEAVLLSGVAAMRAWQLPRTLPNS